MIKILNNITSGIADRLIILLFILIWNYADGLSQSNRETDTLINRNEQKNILLLHSYHKSFQWTSDVNDAIQERLNEAKNIRCFTEYMDTKRYESKDYFKLLTQLYRYKYPKGYIDAIICTDNSALNFIIESGMDLWGDVPVTFCGINNAKSYRQKVDTTRIKGVAENIEIAQSIRTAFKINQQITEILFVTDSTLTGTLLMAEATKAIAAIPFRFIYLDDQKNFTETINQTDFRNKLVFILSLYSKKDKSSNEITNEAVYLLREKKDALIMGPWDFLLNDLAIGGNIIRAKDQGRAAAQIMVETLYGNQPKPFLTPTQYVWMADEKKCIEKEISKSIFPAETIWINRKTNWIKENKETLLYIFLSINVVLMLIFLFVTIRRKQKKAESSWAESEKRLEIALEATTGGLWDMLISERKLFVSDQFARLLGYQSTTEFNMTFENWPKLILDNDMEQFNKTLNTLYSNNIPTINTEVRLLKATGEPEWFAIFGKITQWNANRRPERATGIIININHKKEFEEQLKQAKEKAEISDRLKSSFLTNMSHEIRTPMNAIIGFTEILLTQHNSLENQRQYLNIIKNSGDSLLNLINDIIDISKIESGYMNINIERFRLIEIVDSIKSVIVNQISQYEKEIEFVVNCRQDLDTIIIESDPLRIKQILLNLCTNSVKFTEAGSIELNINYSSNNIIIFSVTDTGVGIPPQFFNTIFERFRQVDENLFRKNVGTGLGLSITKSLVHMLKGEISVTSQLGRGSTFTITMPLPSSEINNKSRIFNSGL